MINFFHGLLRGGSPNLARFSTVPETWKEWAENFRKTPIEKIPHSVVYSHSRGPGGQNVNKLSTRATVRIDPRAFPKSFLGILRARHPSKFTKTGWMIFHCDNNRTQYENLAECYRITRKTIISAIEENTSNPTDPNKTARIDKLINKEKRLKAQLKKKLSVKKESRRLKYYGDD